MEENTDRRNIWIDVVCGAGDKLTRHKLNLGWCRTNADGRPVLQNLQEPGEAELRFFEDAAEAGDCTMEDVGRCLDLLNAGGVLPPVSSVSPLECLAYVLSVMRGADFLQIREELYLRAVVSPLKEKLSELVKSPPSLAAPIRLTSVSAGQRLFDSLGTVSVLKLMSAGLVLVGHRGTIDATDEEITDTLLSSLAHPETPSKVVELNVWGNPRITSVAPFTTSLKKLNARGACGIGDAGLVGATCIEELDAGNNPRITNVTPFAATLKKLDAGGKCGIGDAVLEGATCIEELNACGNPRITTVAPFAATLKKLNAAGKCGISDAGLVGTTCIEELNADDNPRITRRNT